MEKIVEKEKLENKKNEFYENLRVLVIENADGFTKKIKFSGNKIELDNTKGRYITAFTNYTLADFKNKTIRDIKEEIFNFIIQNLKLFTNIDLDTDIDFTIGGWYDRNEGKYFVDLGIAVNDLDIAMYIAKRYGQKAVFDLKEMEEIFV